MAEDSFQGESVPGEMRHFNSVGIDIGSTTTQLVFSKLGLGFVEETHKFDIVDREVVYLSEICLTPFHDDYTIDTERLRVILGDAYRGAGFEAEDIDTGAIIITGVAALRRNAARIVELFSGQMGRFVVATAGPNYEAILAAHGSGAVELSDRRLKTVMNVDVGGGTTKRSHPRYDYSPRIDILRLEPRPPISIPQNNPLAEANGFEVSVGEVVSAEEQAAMASSLADCLFEVIRGEPLSPLTEKLLQTPPLGFDGRLDVVFFSGGVSEYVYGYEERSFGDIGLLLGEEIRRRMCDLEVPVAEPVERIRATVIGESQYTLQVSGTTNLISDLSLLPIRNLPVVAPRFASSVLSVGQMEAEIRRALLMHDLVPGEDPYALAFARSVINQPSYLQMKGLSEAVVGVQRGKVDAGEPLVLVFEADIGMGIGRVIQEEVAPGCALISIDEVKLSDFNYVDIGEPTGDRGFIPVIIKSLVF